MSGNGAAILRMGSESLCVDKKQKQERLREDRMRREA